MVTMASIAIMWHEKHMVKEPSLDFRIARDLYSHRLYDGIDIVCKKQLRLNRQAFTSLCRMLKDHCGLRDTINITVEEALAIFLNILGHNLKNLKVKFDFIRSRKTISRYFNIALCAIIKRGRQYHIQQDIELEGFEDHKWLWFQ